MKARDIRSAFVEDADLDRAIEAWKSGSAPADKLSGSARARILAQAGDSAGDIRRLTGLFFPAWRWAWAGVAPVVALTLAVGILGIPRSGDRVTAETRIEARKNSGEVVFLIANGGTEHRVSRRSEPDRAGTGAAIETTNGTFRDALESGETIVFYRID